MIPAPLSAAAIYQLPSSSGGSERNRLFITASQSLYAVYVEARGAHIA